MKLIEHRKFGGNGVIVSDYIVEFLIAKGVGDVFGYPGGMVTQLMESFRTHASQIRSHVSYHEQAAAFAACGYAQVTGDLGVAYATSGPGATNLVTGICNAYFDSIPCLFITGQVNTNECKQGYGIRQRGFQETEIVPMISGVTKYAARIQDPLQIREYMEDAYEAAISGRPGPVLLDIPMDVMRGSIDIDNLPKYKRTLDSLKDDNQWIKMFRDVVEKARKPVILFGNGIKTAHCQESSRKTVEQFSIPIVTSMLAVDVFGQQNNYFGFIGAYGARAANFIVAKADLVITVGSRMDIRQVGATRVDFAPNAKIVRFDIDANEFEYPVHEKELQIKTSIREALSALQKMNDVFSHDYKTWFQICHYIKDKLEGVDDSYPNRIMHRLAKATTDIETIAVDVGQNQVWAAQSFSCGRNQSIIFSGGHGAMGYALPAAIGACYGKKRKPVLCVAGDGGMQMNIQELQWIAREQLPVKIVVMNNGALGMIRHFQELYYEGKYFQTKRAGGYTSPCFCKIAEAYAISACQITDIGQLSSSLFAGDKPLLVEIMLPEDTYIYPKLEFGKPNQDQSPLLDRELYDELMGL